MSPIGSGMSASRILGRPTWGEERKLKASKTKKGWGF